MNYSMRLVKVITGDSVVIEVLASREGVTRPIAELVIHKATEDVIRTGFENVCKEHARVQEILDGLRG